MEAEKKVMEVGKKSKKQQKLKNNIFPQVTFNIVNIYNRIKTKSMKKVCIDLTENLKKTNDHQLIMDYCVI